MKAKTGYKIVFWIFTAYTIAAWLFLAAFLITNFLKWILG